MIKIKGFFAYNSTKKVFLPPKNPSSLNFEISSNVNVFFHIEILK